MSRDLGDSWNLRRRQSPPCVVPAAVGVSSRLLVQPRDLRRSETAHESRNRLCRLSGQGIALREEREQVRDDSKVTRLGERVQCVGLGQGPRSVIGLS